jgi:hypothetical protein
VQLRKNALTPTTGVETHHAAPGDPRDGLEKEGVMNRIAGLGVTLCVAVGLTACDAPSPTAPGDGSQGTGLASASAVTLAATLNGPRAVKGRLEGSDEYGDACGEGQGILIVSTGRGTVSHFGNAVMVGTSCVNLTDFSVIGPMPFSIKAADGDEAGGFVTGFAFTSYGFDLSTEITWGSGRFEGAQGELTFPTASTGTGIWSSGVEGWITY